jgi:hypothetical protein
VIGGNGGTVMGIGSGGVGIGPMSAWALASPMSAGAAAMDTAAMVNLRAFMFDSLPSGPRRPPGFGVTL